MVRNLTGETAHSMVIFEVQKSHIKKRSSSCCPCAVPCCVLSGMGMSVCVCLYSDCVCLVCVCLLYREGCACVCLGLLHLNRNLTWTSRAKKLHDTCFSPQKKRKSVWNKRREACTKPIFVQKHRCHVWIKGEKFLHDTLLSTSEKDISFLPKIKSLQGTPFSVRYQEFSSR